MIVKFSCYLNFLNFEKNSRKFFQILVFYAGKNCIMRASDDFSNVHCPCWDIPENGAYVWIRTERNIRTWMVNVVTWLQYNRDTRTIMSMWRKCLPLLRTWEERPVEFRKSWTFWKVLQKEVLCHKNSKFEKYWPVSLSTSPWNRLGKLFWNFVHTSTWGWRFDLENN